MLISRKIVLNDYIYIFFLQINPVEPCQSRHSPTRHGTASNSSDVDIHAIKQLVDKACFRRSVQLPISACTEPVFNPKTGLPVSSSPVSTSWSLWSLSHLTPSMTEPVFFSLISLGCGVSFHSDLIKMS